MFDDPATLRQRLAQGFGRQRVLVVGDLMLDAYIWGKVKRVSPEAPVPVVQLSRRSEIPGGAGNVALNLAALGLNVVVVGLIGDDEAGQRICRLVEAAGIQCRPVVASDGRPTIVKTRVVVGHQQLLRIDEEVAAPGFEIDQDRLLEAIQFVLSDELAAVVISDYDKVAMTPRICRTLITEAQSRLPILVDPKGRDFQKYGGATVMTPNRHEFEQVAGVSDLDEPSFREAGKQMRDELGLDFLAVTRGAIGVSVFDDDGYRIIPAVPRPVFDVSGAGDTLIATLTAGLIFRLGRDDAVRLANLAAGIVVGKVGTASVGIDELLAALPEDSSASGPQKICDFDALLKLVSRWRDQGDRMVFTNGCFDLLHAGHIALLTQAKRQGDRLVVGLNSDRSVRVLKGEGRPGGARGRSGQVLAALGCVDAVVLFDEETPLELIQAIRPDVLVKGADYAEDQVVGADLTRSWGGSVVLVPLLEGRSTSRILDRGEPSRTNW